MVIAESGEQVETGLDQWSCVGRSIIKRVDLEDLVHAVVTDKTTEGVEAIDDMSHIVD